LLVDLDILFTGLLEEELDEELEELEDPDFPVVLASYLFSSFYACILFIALSNLFS